MPTPVPPRLQPVARRLDRILAARAERFAFAHFKLTPVALATLSVAAGA